MTTSATGGFLTPASTPTPLEGAALLDYFQVWIAGVTTLAGQFVRPRWQPEPANIPAANVDWVAFGISGRDSDTFAAELHSSDVDGYNEMRRHEVLTLALSFYGPLADHYSQLMRDGIQVAQNREYLTTANMGLVDSSSITPMSELVKEKWYYRLDMDIKVRRQIVQQYNVLGLLSAPVTTVVQK